MQISSNLSSTLRPTFHGALFANGVTTYRNNKTNVEYGVIPCGTGGVWLTRGLSLMHSEPMPREEAVCLIELDAYAL